MSLEVFPQNTKMEKKLVERREVGAGELGVAKRVTSHRRAPDFPSSMITWRQTDSIHQLLADTS